MRPIPHIPPLDNLSDILNLVHNSALYTERLQALNEIMTEINNALGSYKEWGKVEDARNQAASLTTQAKKLKEDADLYYKEKTKAADGYRSEMEIDLSKRADEIRLRSEDLDKQNRYLANYRKELDKEQGVVKTTMRQANDLMAEANRLAEESSILISLYKDKLAKIQAAAA